MLGIPLFKVFKFFFNRIIGSNRRSKRIANEYVNKFYKENGNNSLSYKSNYWCKNKYWDFFFHSLPHVVADHRFVPRDYYAIVVEAALQNERFHHFALEKNYYDKLFNGHNVILPDTYFRLIDNVLLDKSFKRITANVIFERFNNYEVVVKSTLTAEGTCVKKLLIKDKVFKTDCLSIDYRDLQTIFDGNFICQEIIHQHPDLAKYHPGSLNTIRIFTYRSIIDNKVYPTLAMLRMGVHGSFVDNASIDGIACGIELDKGTLMEFAFDKYGNRWSKHPDTDVVFVNQNIPNFETIKDTVIGLADVLSHSRLIGWDIAVSKSGQPVLIEPNTGTGTWMLQLANGRPLFGEFSDEIRNFINKKPFWERLM
jgi:hypothetical protein